MALQVGSVLRHRYRIDGILGQGGMGAVYKAFDVNLGVEVAVKENLFTTAEFERQFEREAKILARLRHPNLPRVSDHFVIEGEGQYLVMDFIMGVDLRQRLERSGAIPEEEALPWFLEICDALAYLHSQTPPILHRDIKPGNIKIMPDGGAILVDFGLAKFFERGGATTTGAKAMTPGFSPPEQYGTGGTDPRTDVYSLGATMYAALTATIPEDSIERAMGHTKLTPIRKLNPEISQAVGKVIEKALAVKPKDRYQTINAFAAALGSRQFAGRPTAVRAYPHLEKPARPTDESPATERATQVLRTSGGRPSRLPLAIFLGLTIVLIVAGLIYMAPTIRAWLRRISASPVATVAFATESRPADPSQTGGGPLSSPSILPGTESAVSTTEATRSAVTTSVISTPTGGGVGQFAYVSEKSGNPQIYLINLDGTDEHQLTNLQEGACQPAWSPNGKRIVFTSPCSKGNRDVYEASSLWLISVDNAGNASDPEPVPVGSIGNFDPAWAPDGKRIAFTSTRDTRRQVYVVDLESGEEENLNNDLGQYYHPTWSPIGDQLMFASTQGIETTIWLMPASGGSEDRFIRGRDKDDTHPDWSKNGQFVLFVRRKENTPPFLMVSPYEDGSTTNKVCLEGLYAGYPMDEPKWSPDGEWIAFETWPEGVNHDIALIDPNCENVTWITSDPAWDYDVDWRPTP